MLEQGQVFRLTSQGAEGHLWAYRHRTGGSRASRRIQRGGLASEQDAREALERSLERFRRANGSRSSNETSIAKRVSPLSVAPSQRGGSSAPRPRPASAPCRCKRSHSPHSKRLPAEPTSPLLFPAIRGGYLDLHNFRTRAWKPAQLAAGIEPPRRIYDLRHTFATFALRAGISTFELSRYMGASLTIIDRHYGHFARDGRQHAIRLLDDLNAPVDVRGRSVDAKKLGSRRHRQQKQPLSRR